MPVQDSFPGGPPTGTASRVPGALPIGHNKLNNAKDVRVAEGGGLVDTEGSGISVGGVTSTNLSSNPTATTVDIWSDTGNDAIIQGATPSLAGVLTAADKSKLNGVAVGATANSSDATLLNRANHSGTQSASSISDLAGTVYSLLNGGKRWGLGTSPAPWVGGGTPNTTVDLGAQGGLADSGTAFSLSSNLYVDAGGEKLKTSGFASTLAQDAGVLTFRSSASSQGAGTQPPMVTRLTLNTSGELGLGATPVGSTRQRIYAPTAGTALLLDGPAIGAALVSGVTLAGGGSNPGDKSRGIYFSSANINAGIWSERYSNYGGDLILATQTVGGSFTDPARVVTIKSDGAVLFNGISSPHTVDGSGSSTGIYIAGGSSAGTALASQNSSNTNLYLSKISGYTGNAFAQFYVAGTQVGSITTNGSTVSYNTTSDQRMKSAIADAPLSGSLLDSVKVRSFIWKSTQVLERFGFIAQELSAVYPEAVYQPTNPDEMQAVDYSKLVPLLVKEVQDLRARLAVLESHD